MRACNTQIGKTDFSSKQYKSEHIFCSLDEKETEMEQFAVVAQTEAEHIFPQSVIGQSEIKETIFKGKQNIAWSDVEKYLHRYDGLEIENKEYGAMLFDRIIYNSIK